VLGASLLPFTDGLGPEPDDVIGAAVDDNLTCSTLHAGRARMAAVYLRLPSVVSPEELARIVTSGIESYLDASSSRIRRNRSSIEVTWPAFGPITSHYGPDHALGIDIGQSTGDIVAATDGAVAFAGGDPCCSYGLYVIIESPSGITTLYGHLSAIYVKEGDHVKAGQPLGPVGSTGHSTGLHLHFETLVDGVRVNPLSVLP
jgi:murein DD-endopeptidase MepM/ murein hydrolase activator NlpD